VDMLTPPIAHREKRFSAIAPRHVSENLSKFTE